MYLVAPVYNPCPSSLSTSNILFVYYLFLDTSEQQVWKLWIVNTVFLFDAPSSRNGTPVNNLIKLISPVHALHFCRWLYMHRSENFRTVLSEKQNANPLDTEPETDFNAKWSFKDIQGHLFRCHWGATKGLHRPSTIYNKCGLACEDLEDIASERSENLHFRPPHSHLTPPLQRTPANIRINLFLLETAIPGLHFCRW